MCHVCCKEFKGWCKSFTRNETYLSVLQLIFLIIFIANLTFIILHFLACSKNKEISKIEHITETSRQSTTTTEKKHTLETSSKETQITSRQTLSPKKIECTWTPSLKTTAVTHFYDTDLILTSTVKDMTSTAPNKYDDFLEIDGNGLKPLLPIWADGEPFIEDNVEKSYDGEIANVVKKSFLLALVKIKPLQDITFGCTLTVIAQSWTITAASCIEAIEEVDSLDSFVMLRGFGDIVESVIYAVSDILIHPLYQGVNRTYDLAALKSEDNIVRERIQTVRLPTMIDYFSTTIGEKLSILGYGKFRNLDKDPLFRSVREVSVYSLPSQQCGGEGGWWSPRHLAGGSAAGRARCGAGPLCAGALRARAKPCHYCAGAPLLRHHLLLGIMSDNPHCGLACEPALYVNLAMVRGWLNSIIYSD